MTTHYQTLELPEQASADDIRRAYRRLVLLTHPDRTPDPAAHAQYLAVNDAYEVLGNTRRRAGYDALLWAQRNPSPPSPPVPASAPVSPPDRRYPPRPAVPQGPRPERYAAEYARYAPYARWVCRLALVLCALLLLDFCLTTSHDEAIQRLDGFTDEVPAELSRAVAWHSIETEHVSFKYFNEYADSLYVGQRLRLRQTPLFGVVRSVGDPALPLAPSLHEPATIYSPFLFIPLLMAGAGFLGLLPGVSDRRRVEAGICLGLLLPICLFILLNS